MHEPGQMRVNVKVSGGRAREFCYHGDTLDMEAFRSGRRS